jgi:N-acetyl-1-D-myo-inositol-2-amino-2-deoxy-alpha-D-glucopyranoside deacetylase
MQRQGLEVERTLIIAPHPDDDVIAAGGLIQHVLSSGGKLTVVYVTDGENNPWPQRALERRLIIRAEDRRRWGSMRRAEALAALAVLGAPDDASRFLGFPDHRIASLLLSGDRRLEHALATAIDDFDPTLVIMPSHYDLHPDHRAIASFSRRALERGSGPRSVRTYLLHGSSARARVQTVLQLSTSERARKERAILTHRSQLYLSRSRFLTYARRFETFCCEELDLPERRSRVSFFFASLWHVATVLSGPGAQPIPSPREPQSADTPVYDPATRNA